MFEPFDKDCVNSVVPYSSFSSDASSSKDGKSILLVMPCCVIVDAVLQNRFEESMLNSNAVKYVHERAISKLNEKQSDICVAYLTGIKEFDGPRTKRTNNLRIRASNW